MRRHLIQLIWSIRKRNETGILDRVYNLRHELLLWKNLLIPIKELIMAIEETNFHGINKGEIFDSYMQTDGADNGTAQRV